MGSLGHVFGLLFAHSFRYRTSDCTESPEGRRRKLRVEQKFAIAFAAKEGRRDPFGARATEFRGRRLDSGHGRSLCRFVAHDSAFPHQFPARFELRFHQHYNLADVNRTNDFAIRTANRRSGVDHRRQDQSVGYEGDIHGYEVNRPAKGARREIAGRWFLQKPNARVASPTEIHLAITRSEREYPSGS